MSHESLQLTLQSPRLLHQVVSINLGAESCAAAKTPGAPALAPAGQGRWGIWQEGNGEGSLPTPWDWNICRPIDSPNHPNVCIIYGIHGASWLLCFFYMPKTWSKGWGRNEPSRNHTPPSLPRDHSKMTMPRFTWSGSVLYKEMMVG